MTTDTGEGFCVTRGPKVSCVPEGGLVGGFQVCAFFNMCVACMSYANKCVRLFACT